MIKEQSYTTEWLDSKVKEYDAASYDLAEKMVYALTLLEHLKLKGLDFIFKGGTSLVLMVDEFHRFSKDIDIIIHTKPDNLHEIFDAVVADAPFIRWEESERKNDEFQVPKEHYKFTYKESKPSKFPEKPILLDIIFVENSYPETRVVKVDHSLLVTEEPYAEIIIPTFDSITGDKLTAFAPKTIGIPIGKNKEVEIAKQLFDLNMLFDKISSYDKVGQSFEKTAAVCIDAYKKNYTIEEIYNDVIETSYTMALMGKYDVELYNEIKTGVNALSQYLSKKANFGYNKALLAAARVAYLAACLMKGVEQKKLDWQSVTPEEFKNKKINHEKYSVLNKALKGGYPEAWFYWLNTVEVLALEKTERKGSAEIAKATVVSVIEDVQENPKKNNEVKSNLIHLVFIVNGKETLVDNLNPNEQLRAAVERALAQTGNSGRQIEEWSVKLNNHDLDISKKIEDYKFSADAKIFLSLKSGVGGNK
jgi:hypothetical protein